MTLDWQTDQLFSHGVTAGPVHQNHVVLHIVTLQAKWVSEGQGLEQFDPTFVIGLYNFFYQGKQYVSILLYPARNCKRPCDTGVGNLNTVKHHEGPQW